MKYDFNFLEQYFKNYNVTIKKESNIFFEITLDQDVTIHFQNTKHEDDSLISVVNGEWHSHDDIIFSGKNGYYTSLHYFDYMKFGDELRIKKLKIEKS